MFRSPGARSYTKAKQGNNQDTHQNNTPQANKLEGSPCLGWYWLQIRIGRRQCPTTDETTSTSVARGAGGSPTVSDKDKACTCSVSNSRIHVKVLNQRMLRAPIDDCLRNRKLHATRTMTVSQLRHQNDTVSCLRGIPRMQMYFFQSIGLLL